jgi:hypothetical protein
MKVEDAAKILGVFGELTPAIIKDAYRHACATYHPDRNPAGLEMMKSVNAAYDVLRDYSGVIDEPDKGGNYAAQLYSALQIAVTLTGVSIEVCGAWVWLSGNTLVHCDTLRKSKETLPDNNGFRWAPKKKMWYYRPQDWRSFSRGSWSMDEIRDEYGANTVANKVPKALRSTA